MNIPYDDRLRFAGIGVTPWSRLGLERWFPRYEIVAYRDGGASALEHMPPLHTLDGEVLPKASTMSMVASKAFRNMAAGPLAEFSFVPYRPMDISDSQFRGRFLMNDARFTATYENKAWLRETFAAQLPFAPFTILERWDLLAGRAAYEQLASKLGGSGIVLQHESLSGGKGTYTVSGFEGFEAALQALPTQGRVVVSQMIEKAYERSIQCCVTRYGTVTGRLQKQLVRARELVHHGVPSVNGFCGGEIGTVELSAAAEQAVRNCVDTIGNRMAEDGYKGIFGLDFLIRGDEVFLLEVNARMTGLTPLNTALAALGAEIPLGVLHVLELAGADFDRQMAEEPIQNRPGSMLVLQHLGDYSGALESILPSGVYHFDGNRLEHVRNDSTWDDSDTPDTVLVQDYVQTGSSVRPGQKLMTVLIRQPVTDADDKFTNYAKALIASLYDTVRIA